MYQSYQEKMNNILKVKEGQVRYIHILSRKMGLSEEGLASSIMLWVNKSLDKLSINDADKVIKCMKSIIHREK